MPLISAHHYFYGNQFLNAILNLLDDNTLADNIIGRPIVRGHEYSQRGRDEEDGRQVFDKSAQ